MSGTAVSSKMGSHLIVGTYTETLPHVIGLADGILSYRFSESVQPPAHTTALRNPSWVALSPTRDRLYSVIEAAGSELDGHDAEPTGGVAAFARATVTGILRLINVVSSHGTIPAHLALAPSGRFVVVANYGNGKLSVLEIMPDGRLGSLRGQAHHQGRSPVQAHPHQVVFDEVSGDLYVPDVGLDAVLVCDLTSDGCLVERVRARLLLHPGAGPRHIAFDPDGAHLFMLNESDSTLCVYRRLEMGFEFIGKVSTLPPGYTAPNSPGAVRVTADGRHVYTANRGHDSSACFAFNQSASAIRLISLRRSQRVVATLLNPECCSCLSAMPKKDATSSSGL